MNERYLELITERIPEEELLAFFKRHGAVERSRNDKHVWFNTFCHGGDSNKLCYNRETKTFYCYTHCGFLSIFTLAKDVLHVSFSHAVDILARLAGVDIRRTFDAETWIEHSWVEDLQKYVEARQYKINVAPFEFPIIKEGVLNYFEHKICYTGWLEEGISPDAMVRFDICWDEVQLAIIIPHRDKDGRLIGIRKRPVEALAGKYTPVRLQKTLYAHPLGMNLYGLYEHRDAIARTQKAIIFEGEKSVLKHETIYGSESTAVACCGSHVSDVQRQLLLDLGVREVVLAFDKDHALNTPEGMRDKRKVELTAQMFTPFMQTYALIDYHDLLPLTDSPIDDGKETFEKLMGNRRLLTTKRRY